MQLYDNGEAELPQSHERLCQANPGPRGGDGHASFDDVRVFY